MGYTKQEADALNSVACGIVERAIASLQGIGMSHEGALNLLAIQAVVRMDTAATAKMAEFCRSFERREPS